MMNREKIQFCHVKCRNTAVPRVHRTAHKAKNNLEEQVTKDSKTSNEFCKPILGKKPFIKSMSLLEDQA